MNLAFSIICITDFSISSFQSALHYTQWPILLFLPLLFSQFGTRIYVFHNWSLTFNASLSPVSAVVFLPSYTIPRPNLRNRRLRRSNCPIHSFYIHRDLRLSFHLRACLRRSSCPPLPHIPRSPFLHRVFQRPFHPRNLSRQSAWLPGARPYLLHHLCGQCPHQLLRNPFLLQVRSRQPACPAPFRLPGSSQCLNRVPRHKLHSRVRSRQSAYPAPHQPSRTQPVLPSGLSTSIPFAGVFASINLLINYLVV
jgi:hypothetical protein